MSRTFNVAQKDPTRIPTEIKTERMRERVNMLFCTDDGAAPATCEDSRLSAEMYGSISKPNEM